jgi:gliding motility-associated lipoprotein GldD
MSKYKFIIYTLLVTMFALASCKHKTTPKPSGYFRIDFPEKKYQLYTQNSPYQFEYPVYSKIMHPLEKDAQPYWINIVFPSLNGTIYLSYFTIHNDLAKYAEDSRTLAYKHTIKAESIDERTIAFPKKKVYGIIYEINGNTASSINFVLTDSTKNFLRGALYFDSKPNKDSLAPVIVFIKKDIDHLIETFSWK